MEAAILGADVRLLLMCLVHLIDRLQWIAQRAHRGSGRQRLVDYWHMTRTIDLSDYSVRWEGSG